MLDAQIQDSTSARARICVPSKCVEERAHAQHAELCMQPAREGVLGSVLGTLRARRFSARNPKRA
eukprot:13136061-Alexandrium_andersonii.AAC.1